MMTALKTIYHNFLLVYRDWRYSLAAVILLLLMGTLFTVMTNEEMIAGNFGLAYLYVTLVFQYAIVVLFAIFVPATIYKFLMFNTVSYHTSIFSAAGSLLGILVGGCAACSITIASFLGLAGFLAALPWYGLELKILGALLLGYAVMVTLRDLTVCKVKTKKRATS